MHRLAWIVVPMLTMAACADAGDSDERAGGDGGSATNTPPAEGASGLDGDGTVEEEQPPHYCDPQRDWPASLTADEDEVLRLVNEHRAAGADCGVMGVFEPTHALVMDPKLRCAARMHSLDMYEEGYFSHSSPDGSEPSDRMAAAGYSGFFWGENIGRGARTPATAVAGWMSSDGHCANIMHPGFEEIGVGRVDTYWTQKFGRPR
jgi:uncharacterized protein YkwD